MESPLAASPFPPLGSNQVSALGDLATSTTLDVPFPSLLPSLRVDPESTRNRPPPFSPGLPHMGQDESGNERVTGNTPSLLVPPDMMEGIGLRSGWDTSLASSTDLCSTTSSIRTPPSKIRPFLRILWTVWAAGQNWIWPIAPPPLPANQSFPTTVHSRWAVSDVSRQDRLTSPSPLLSRGPTRPSCKCVWFLGSQSVQGLCSPSALTGRSSRINAPHSPLSLARFGPRRF